MYTKKTDDPVHRKLLSLVDYMTKLYRVYRKAGRKLEEVKWEDFVVMMWRGVTLIAKEKKMTIAIVVPTAAYLGESYFSLH